MRPDGVTVPAGRDQMLFQPCFKSDYCMLHVKDFIIP
jgi:hypothetical protein